MKRNLLKGEKAYAEMPMKIKGVDKESYTLTMIASTQGVDRHGDTIIQSGWDLSTYKKNPVILNSHNYSDATEVIAKATKTVIEGKGKSSKLIQEWKFAVEENPKAKIIFDLYAGGYLNASSVGFIPTKFKEDKMGNTDYFTIEEAQLLEVSAVSVPANAMALAKAKGIDVDRLEDDKIEEEIEEFVQEKHEDEEIDEEEEKEPSEADLSEIEGDEEEVEVEEDVDEVIEDEFDDIEEEERTEPVEEEEKSVKPSKKELQIKAIKKIREDLELREAKKQKNLDIALETIKRLGEIDQQAWGTCNSDKSDRAKAKSRLINKAIRNLLKAK